MIKFLISTVFLFGSVLACAETFNGINLPRNIAEFHYQKFVDYERTKQKGLGYGVEYSAPGVKATVFIYNFNFQVSNSVDSQEVRNAFLQAIKDIKHVYPNVQQLEEPKKISIGGQDFMFAKFRVLQGNENLISYIYITSAKRNFIKVRLTYSDDGHETLGQSMQRAFMVDLTRSLE